MGAREREDLGVLEERRLAASRFEGGDTALILKDGVWRALPRSEYDAEAVSLGPLEAFCMCGRKSAVDLGGVLNLGAYAALVEYKEGRGIVCEARAENTMGEPGETRFHFHQPFAYLSPGDLQLSPEVRLGESAIFFCLTPAICSVSSRFVPYFWCKYHLRQQLAAFANLSPTFH